MRVSTLVILTMAGTIGMMIALAPLIAALYVLIATLDSSSRSAITVNFQFTIPGIIAAVSAFIGIVAGAVSVRRTDWRFGLAPIVLLSGGVGFLFVDWRLWAIVGVVYTLTTLEMLINRPKPLTQSVMQPQYANSQPNGQYTPSQSYPQSSQPYPPQSSQPHNYNQPYGQPGSSSDTPRPPSARP